MNRLILIGNGFDLAHGLPTSFRDFLLHHFKEGFESFNKGNPELHEFFKFDFLGSGPFGGPGPGLKNISYQNEKSVYKLISQIKRTDHRLKLTGIFKPLVPKNPLDLWVDVERAYFNELRKAVTKTNELEPNPSEVMTLNRSLKIFMDHFEEYLKAKVVPSIKPELKIPAFQEIFDRPIEKQYVINFNYTDVISLYDQFSVNSNATHIHGQIGKGNLVFGYGDEHDKSYRTIEDMNEDVFLEYTKSPWYTIEHEFSRLLAFLNRPYEVYVIGHSCGLSDRTLLKDIFERKECTHITLFHRGTKDSHRKMAMRLSRHFSDKSSMRKKVIPYQEANTCPSFDQP